MINHSGLEGVCVPPSIGSIDLITYGSLFTSLSPPGGAWDLRSGGFWHRPLEEANFRHSLEVFQLQIQRWVAGMINPSEEWLGSTLWRAD